MSREEGSGEFIAGFFMGALVGAAIALLMAPISGEEMRTQISQKGIELKDRAGDLSVEASKRAEEIRVKGQSVLEEQKARFQDAIEEGKQAASRKKEELIAQIEAARTSEGSAEPAQPTA